MSLALNTNNALVSGGNVKVCIGVDPTSGVLVDLARPSTTFTLDAGVTYVETAIGKGVRCVGTGDTPKGIAFTDYTIPTQVAHEGTLLMVFDKQTGQAAGGVHPARLPNSAAGSQNIMLSFDQSTGAITLNDGNTSTRQIPVTPSQVFTNDGKWHTVAIHQWNVGGWNTLQGHLFVDGLDTGVSITNCDAGEMHLNSFGKGFYASWAGDFVWLVWVNKKMTTAEIKEWHDSINTSTGMSLVTGAGVAGAPSGTPVTPAAPAGTVTIGTVTPGETSATVAYTYSGSDATSYQYRLNGGAAFTLAASVATLTGLTSGTAYNLEVRATNETGQGAWSAVKSFTTTSSAPAQTSGTVTISEAVANNAGAPWVSKTGIVANVMRDSDMVSVATVTGLSTNSTGHLSAITHASIVPGTSYRVAVKLTEGAVGVSAAIVAS